MAVRSLAAAVVEGRGLGNGSPVLYLSLRRHRYALGKCDDVLEEAPIREQQRRTTVSRGQRQQPATVGAVGVARARHKCHSNVTRSPFAMRITTDGGFLLDG